MDKTKKTQDVYSFLWKKESSSLSSKVFHFNNMQEVIPIPIVSGAIGIDIGSGCGYDTYVMAKNNPEVKIISLDISDGVYRTKEFTKGLSNVRIVKGSVLSLPFKSGIFDFAYSFGVLHHTVDPKFGLKEIERVIKKDKAAFLYLYEDHQDNRIKYSALKIINFLRHITVRIPRRILYGASFLFSPVVVFFFTVPSKILKKLKSTKHLSEKIPFNFGTHPFSLAGDLYDRFSAPIEHRFNKCGVFALFTESGFRDVRATKLKNTAGWVAWGFKNNA